MFETPFIERTFKGKTITFNVTMSGAVLGNSIPPLNQLPAIMSHFRKNKRKTILDFGAGKSLRNAKTFALDPYFDVYISEYEQLISHSLSLNELKEPTRFVTALRQPRTPLSQYLQSKLSTETQNLLSKYNGPKPPTKSLQQAIIDELNQLLQSGSLYDEGRFAKVRLTQRVQTLIAQNPTHRKKLLRLNRFLLQDAYSSEIAKCSQTLEKLLYPEEIEDEPPDRFEAILLSYVLHILPDEAARMEVLEACWEKASTDGLLVVASPNYNTNARAACSPADKYNIGWVKYNTPASPHKAFYSEPTQEYLINLVQDAGFEYEDNWHQSTAKVLRFRKG